MGVNGDGSGPATAGQLAATTHASSRIAQAAATEKKTGAKKGNSGKRATDRVLQKRGDQKKRKANARDIR